MSYDNILKYLAEEYPREFVNWLLPGSSSNIQILKTELNNEPIRADSLTLLQVSNQILHIEFQTLPESNPSIPFRMLDYWVRLYRQYGCEINQVVIYLKPSNSEKIRVDSFKVGNTSHSYRVIRIWEIEPELFLTTPGLLPLAVLAKTDLPERLLGQIANEVNKIEVTTQKQNISACIQILAGLKFDNKLIKSLFKEEVMKESVVYQEIIQEGFEQGRQKQVILILRLLNRRIGKISAESQQKIEALDFDALENLGEALLDFMSEEDLIKYMTTNRS